MPLPLLMFPGQRGGSQVYHGGDGLHYNLRNVRANRRCAYLRCVHYRSAKYGFCPGTAKFLRGGGSLYHLHHHSHGPDLMYPLVQALKKDILMRVKAGDQSSFIDIIQQEGQKYPAAVRANVAAGSFVSRLNTIRSGLRPNVPRSLGVLGACLLLPQYQYLTQCRHVPESLFAGMCGSMADGTLSLVFISPEVRIFMETRSMVFGDGTERKLFREPKASQIYTISAAWRFHVITMARMIMLRRTTQAYVAAFDFLKELMPNFRPTSVKCDFEEAQQNAWRICFPHASIEGCLWHFDVMRNLTTTFCDSVLMARNKLQLYDLVKEEEEVASIVRSAGALPLLPTEDIVDALEDLGWEAHEKGWMPRLKPFFQYLVKEWMPKVPVLSVKDSVHRTNNISESGNRALNKAIRVSNPSCFDVVRAFVVTNDKTTNDMHTLAAALAPGRGRKVSALRNDAKIKHLTTDFENGDITRLQFLHRASRRVQNVFNKVFR